MRNAATKIIKKARLKRRSEKSTAIATLQSREADPLIRQAAAESPEAASTDGCDAWCSGAATGICRSYGAG